MSLWKNYEEESNPLTISQQGLEEFLLLFQYTSHRIRNRLRELHNSQVSSCEL